MSLPQRTRFNAEPRTGEADRLRYPEEPSRGWSKGEEYLSDPEEPEQPREAALDSEAKEAVDESSESSFMFDTTFSNKGWSNRKESVPGATNKSLLTDSDIGQAACAR